MTETLVPLHDKLDNWMMRIGVASQGYIEGGGSHHSGSTLLAGAAGRAGSTMSRALCDKYVSTDCASSSFF